MATWKATTMSLMAAALLFSYLSVTGQVSQFSEASHRWQGAKGVAPCRICQRLLFNGCGQDSLLQVPSIVMLTAHMEALGTAVQRTSLTPHCKQTALHQQACFMLYVSICDEEEPTGFIMGSIATLPAAVHNSLLHVAAQQLSGRGPPA